MISFMFIAYSLFSLNVYSLVVPRLKTNFANTSLFAKKDKKTTAYKANAAPSKAEKQGREDRFVS